MEIGDILTLLGGVALFLFGMILMGDNLKKVAGSKLELILYRLSSTPLKGILLGTGVTAIIQSSSATSVMVVGFVNSGMMKARQAIGVVMGAIIGTSITGWIICLSAIGDGTGGWIGLLSTESLSAIIAVAGILLRMFSSKPTRRHVGEILMGFAVLMFGMAAMSDSVSGLKSDPTFIEMMTAFSNPIIGILVGIAFTSILQSASAAVGILQALSVTGAITFDVSFSLIMGIAIGAAVPVLLSAIGANTEGKRTAFSYLVVTVIGVAVFSAGFYGANYFMHFGIMSTVMNVFSIALLNSVFRVINIMITAPFVRQMEAICAFLVKGKADEQQELRDMEKLEERFLAHPSIAIEQSRLTVNSMAQKSMENLFSAFGLFESYSDEGFDKIAKAEDIVDKYEDKIGSYLIRISEHELNPEQNGNIAKYLHTITDLERISDHSVNIAECAKEMHEKQISLSPEADREMNILVSAVKEIMELTVRTFISNDMQEVYRVEPLEELIDNLCDELKMHHIDRLQKGQCTLGNGYVFTDLLTNLERIGDHCSNIAVAMIELESEGFDAHEYIDSLNKAHTKSFDEYFAEYSGRFAL